MTLHFKFSSKKDLFIFFQNFYFTKALHSRVKIIIDKSWTIKQEYKQRIFSCTEERIIKNKNKNKEDQPVHYAIYFSQYPHSLIRSVLWKKINEQPCIECLECLELNQN